MKPAPAFQCYASNIIAKKEYRLMSLAERGLLTSIYYECWPNKCVPADHNELAKYLHVDVSEIKACLTQRVLSFIEIRGGNIFSPEFEEYRAVLLERNRKKSEGGKKGANIRRDKAISGLNIVQNKGKPEAPLSKSKPKQTNQDQSAADDMPAEQDPWVDDYERASRGS